MTRLQLDYQARTRPFPWAGAILCALALAVAGLAGAYYHSLRGQIAYWDGLARQSGRGSAPRVPRNKIAASDMALEIKHANEVLSKITLPWDKLFQAVEWSSGQDVALLGIEPNAEKNEVKISGEAKNMMAVLGYLRHLTAQEVISSAYLRSHQVQQQDPDKPVRFSLVAAWKGGP